MLISAVSRCLGGVVEDGGWLFAFVDRFVSYLLVLILLLTHLLLLEFVEVGLL